MNRRQTSTIILFGIVLLVYTIPLIYNALVTPFFHTVPSQDVVSTSLVPISVLTRGDFYIDQYRKFITNNYAEPYFAADVNNHLVSRYPVAAGMLALPFMGVGLGTGWIARTVYVFDVAKFSAAFITAFAVLAFFLCARLLTNVKTSVLATVAFGFGTSVWSTASQGLWQHTPSVLFLSLALWFLIRGERSGANTVAPAGMFLALAFVSRPTTLVIAAVFALYVLIEYRSAFIRFALWGVPPVLLFLLYNYAVNGSPFVFGYQEGVASQFGLPQWEAIQGLLFSTGRGLFVYSPFLLLAPIGLALGWKSPRRNLYIALTIAGVAYTLIMAAWGSMGGWAYGSRMLTDALPVLCLLMIPAVERMQGVARLGLWGVIIAAIFLQSLGIWDYGLRFHSDPANSIWSLENSEPVFYIRLYISMIQESLGL
jgi:hypothetical protein